MCNGLHKKRKVDYRNHLICWLLRHVGASLLDSAMEVISRIQMEVPEPIKMLTETYSASFTLFHFSRFYLQAQLEGLLTTIAGEDVALP